MVQDETKASGAAILRSLSSAGLEAASGKR
jgi:hypothetical protein